MVQSSTTLVITPVADNTVEPDETVRVNVLGGNDYLIGAPAFADGVIANDDNTIVCTGGTSVLEATPAAAGNTITFTCTRTTNGAHAANPLAVPYTIGGSPGNVGDYTVDSATFNFAGGGNSQQATVTVTTVPDADVEGDETVTLTFASGEAGAFGYWFSGQGVLTGTIQNDDNDVSVAVSITNPEASGNRVTENGGRALRYTFTRTTGGFAATQALPVGFAVTGLACSSGPCAGDPSTFTDYVLTGASGWTPAGAKTGSVTIAANQTSVSIVVTPNGDTDVEPNEDVIVTTSTGANYDPVADLSAQGWIDNDDTSYTISSQTDGSESDGLCRGMAGCRRRVTGDDLYLYC